MVSSPSTFIKTSQIVLESTPALVTTETVSSSMKVQISTIIQTTPALRAKSTMTTSTVVQQFSSDTIMTTKSLDVLPVTSSLTSCNRTVKNIQLYLGFHGNLNEVNLCFSLNHFYGMTKLS